MKRELPADLVEKLCCPETHQALRLASAGELEKLRQLAEQGKLSSQSGQKVSRFEQVLIREDATLGYLVDEGIPVLLPAQAISIRL
jgi:uncharacterized protein YbaR (Trm112 family)